MIKDKTNISLTIKILHLRRAFIWSRLPPKFDVYTLLCRQSSPLSYFAQKTSLNLAPNWYPIIVTCPVRSDSCKDPLKFLFLWEFK
jgi:hypothetical protein